MSDECPAMKNAIAEGLVLKIRESIDNESESTNFYIGVGDGVCMIRHCPFCGIAINNLMVPKGQCKDFKERQADDRFDRAIELGMDP